jgi:predicted enzyme related to lactoylglutathione lyase
MNAQATRIRTLMAGVVVDDLKAAARWYETVLGREPDSAPMGGLLEWHISGEAMLQIVDIKKVREVQGDAGWGGTGCSSVSFVVDNLDNQMQLLADNHIKLVSKFTSNPLLRTATVADPFGNYITFVEQGQL